MRRLGEGEDKLTILRNRASCVERVFRLCLLGLLFARSSDVARAFFFPSNSWRRGLRRGQSHALILRHRDFGKGVAHVLRLIALALLLFVGSASALVPMTYSFTLAGVAVFRATPQQACDDGLIEYARVYQVTVTGHRYWPTGDNGRPGCGIGFNEQDGSYLERMVGFNWGGLMCPANSTPSSGLDQCSCGDHFQEDASKTMCVPAAPEPIGSCRNPAVPSFSVDGLLKGNPISPVTAEKVRSETDWSDSGLGVLFLTRTYRSNWASDSARVGNPLGQVWSHNFSTKLVATPAASPSSAAMATLK